MNDLISRQAAIEAIEHRLAEPAYQHMGEDWYAGLNCAESELYNLPSAQPEHSEGLYVDGYNDGYRDGMKDVQPNLEEDEDIPMEYFENGGI